MSVKSNFIIFVKVGFAYERSFIMLYVLIVVAVVVLALVCEKVFRMNTAGAVIACVISIVGGFILTVAYIAGTCSVLHYQTSLVMVDKDITFLEEKYERQVAAVREVIKTYPLEEALLKSFNPKILLKLPEIKSNGVLIAHLNVINYCLDNIYKHKLRKTGYQRKLDWYSHRWLTTSLI